MMSVSDKCESERCESERYGGEECESATSDDGDDEGGGGKGGCREKSKNPTQRCGEQAPKKAAAFLGLCLKAPDEVSQV